MTKYDTSCLYETKDIAMDILKHMGDLASTCGYVTVNQYLEMSGIDECVEGGNEWGWYAKTIMDTVGVKTRCGWILDLGNPCLVVDLDEIYEYVTIDDFNKISNMKSKHIFTLENILNDQAEKNAHPYKSGKYPFGYDSNTTPVILIDYAEASIQNYIKYGNLNNLKAARDILITAIIELEDEESEEK